MLGVSWLEICCDSSGRRAETLRALATNSCDSKTCEDWEVDEVRFLWKLNSPICSLPSVVTFKVGEGVTGALESCKGLGVLGVRVSPFFPSTKLSPSLRNLSEICFLWTVEEEECCFM